ncbi:plasmacytoid dendritic cell antigen processing and presentation [Mactra antiquata]
MHLLTVLSLIVQFCFSIADYTCICSHVMELPVFSREDTTSAVLGSLHEFDCKPLYGRDNENGDFQSIQFKQQIGYVEIHSMVMKKCNGPIPISDLVTKMTTKATTSASMITPLIAVWTATSPVTPLKTHAMTTATQSMTAKFSMTTTASPSEKTASTYPMTSSTVPSIKTVTEATVTQSSNRSTLSMTSLTTSTTTTTQTTPTTTTQPKILRRCPDYWTRHHDSCYRFIIDEKESQKNAVQECISLDSHLVLVNSASEQSYLANYLSGIWSYVRDHDDEVWILGTDHENEGTWVYTDDISETEKPLPYTHWATDQPDDPHGKHEDCVALNRDSKFQWYDFECNQHFHYICERPAYSTPGVNIIG